MNDIKRKVYIIWEDSRSYTGWQLFGENYRTEEIKTIGYVIEETKKHIAISSSIGEHMAADVLVIPMKCIKEMYDFGLDKSTNLARIF